jgi:ArsR family transcriptional regulator, arsenate/arsenite/antimonite-responsive transcriptional repressor / arsenate reductase (thioredoxin)
MENMILARLTTLGHPQRMAVFRLLMRRFPDAVPAGELARALSLKASTLSVYLSALTGVGLISKTRYGTSLQYQARLEAAREVMDYLFLDCCRGRPQLCPPLDLGAPCGTQPDQPKRNVAFICTGNSARSILAESILRHEAGHLFNAFSAGTRPADAPNPLALNLLRGRGHDITGLRSKTLEELRHPDAPHMDFIFTVCDSAANEECPIWPGHPISGHWGIPDPAAETGTQAQKEAAFALAHDRMQARIRAFTALVPDRFDKAALQARIDEIGHMPHEIQV